MERLKVHFEGWEKKITTDDEREAMKEALMKAVWYLNDKINHL